MRKQTMSDYKLIAFDMDGTLLNSEKKISEETQHMIQQAFEAGKEVILSTGRCMAELQDYLKILPGLRYAICVSGALVYDLKEKKKIFTRGIPLALAEQILEASKKEDTMVQVLTMESIVQSDRISCMSRYGMGQYQSMFERITRKVDDIYAFYGEYIREAEKINLYHRTVEDRERSRERLKALELELADAEETSLECSALGVTKGLGLQKLCEYLNIPMAQTIAVGDADNDIDILKAAGLSIAMGNANETVKGICDVVVSDCDHDGCAEAIRRYLL